MLFFLSGFGKLIYITVLLLNAIAVLSEDRFLARIGMGRSTMAQENVGFGGTSQNPDSVKSRLINLISSIRMVTRVPLIAVNIVIIFYEVLFG